MQGAGARRILAMGLTSWILAVAALGGTQDSVERPNIVIVLADDLGYGDPRCYNAESKVPTPHVDRLAREGTRFTDAHSSASVCTPTRYALLTGRYAWRTALDRSVLWPWDPPLLEDERVTLPELLREAGYDTACIGKWHLGWDWPLDASSSVTREIDGHSWPAERREEIGARVNWDRPVKGGPLAHGFDHYFGDDVPNFPPYVFLEDERVVARPTSTKPAEMFGHAGPSVQNWDLSAVLPRLARHATAWIDERGRRDRPRSRRPFFLYLPLTSPHTPIAPAAPFVGKSEAGPYGDFVHETDWVLGQVLQALDRNGFAENTLVVFTSDNGSPQRDGTDMSGPVGSVRERYGHDPSRPWRGLKSDAWEGGHRVPFVARWPGRVPKGRVSEEPFVQVDLYRTLANLVGQEVDAENGEDSFDISEPLFDRAGAEPARDHLVHHSGNGSFAIRAGEWKLIQGKGSGGFSSWKPPAGAPPGQLYRLARDPGETRNVYRDHPEIVNELTALLDEIRNSGRSVPAEGRASRWPDGEWRELFDGKSLEGWEVTPFGGEGPVRVTADAIEMEYGSMLTGIRLADSNGMPRTNYELRVVAARLSGTDAFCALTFPVGDSHATLVAGGWGGELTGISNLDGRDASLNETATRRLYESGRDYALRVRVTPERIRAWVDGETVADVSLAGREVGPGDEALLARPLGVSSYATTARVRRVRVMPFASEPAPLRVLLLGDSISIGYTPYVAELLGERARVVRAQKVDGEVENCEGTTYGVRNLERWLEQETGEWDVIHFNFGLHDLKRVMPDTGKNSNDPEHPHQASPERYEAQLRSIVAKLRETGARLVYATTTPVPEGVRPYRAPADAERYNAVALRVMRESDIPINDLHGFAQPRLSELQNPRDVHFTTDGSKALAGEVARAVLEVVAR